MIWFGERGCSARKRGKSKERGRAWHCDKEITKGGL